MFHLESRQNGLGYCSFMARIGVSVTTVVFLLEEVWVNLPSLIFFLVAFAASLVTLFLPETKNIRLPETIEDVEQTRCHSRFWVEAQHALFSLLFTFLCYSDANIDVLCVAEDVPRWRLRKRRRHIQSWRPKCLTAMNDFINFIE